ncbi:hypothetical protein HYH03_001069 [Edaphochlamys debaryana]|uniref:Glycosyltransferase 2-like domain-containing protein n=1 Tax=Edaphochlamys debaryana TaxID=47281 RepID=A0A835YGE6_9CHLO|nr:hypothetical protein HYH03_001069 [Edaphochlamys debaryana]|eukprot:KAG2501262.1 hypothetical protein HYH03_001069 [Edaphochlamys debaryana]
MRSRVCGLLRLLALAFLVLHVAAGPDPNPLAQCGVLVGALQDSRHYRDAVDATQALWRAKKLVAGSAAAGTAELANATERLTATLRSVDTVWQRAGGSADVATALALTCLSARVSPSRDPTDRPVVVSILLNYFQRPQFIAGFVQELKASCDKAGVPCELVVNVDNPHEAAMWANVTAAYHGFVHPVFSYNVHEARGYNRAARVARGEIFVVWQDDNMPPYNPDWLLDMVALFRTYSRLGILGLNYYRLCRHLEMGNRVGRPDWESDIRPGRPVAWTFAHMVDFAPLAFRAAAFWSVGGIEEGWSNRGDCGITTDFEISARAWLSGWLVGKMDLAKRDEGFKGGTTHKGVGVSSCWGRQMFVGGEALSKRFYKDGQVFANATCQRAWLLNVLTFTPKGMVGEPGCCPYLPKNAAPARIWANCTAPEPAAGLQRLVESGLPVEYVPWLKPGA